MVYRLYPTLKYILLTILIAGVGVSLIGTCVSGLVFEDNSCSLRQDIGASLIAYGPRTLFVFLLLLMFTFVAKRDYLYNEARQQFAIAKPAEDLHPADFGYRPVQPGAEVTPRHRPFYKEYVPRNLTPAPESAAGASFYHEDNLVHEARSGTDFVLLGPPLSGKSRLLYEIVRKFEGSIVIAPLKDTGLPTEKAFSEMAKNKEVVVLLEDLNDYVSISFPLREFVRRLERYAKSYVVAATCRNGSEMAIIKGVIGTEAGRFYEEIPLKLILEPLSAAEKGELARSIGKSWDPLQSDLYPTPGSIAMEDSVSVMRNRFEHTLSSDQKYALRALLLLASAGVPFTQLRLRLIMEHPNLFRRKNVHIQDCLEALTDQAFLQLPALQDPIRPEPAYLLNAVSYVTGREPEEDFPFLRDSLEECGDAEGLLYFGARLGLEDYEQALPVLDKVVRLKPNYPEAWVNKGIALYKLGYYEEALKAQEEALTLNPDYPDALVNKANALDELERREEALDNLERALELRPGFPDALNNKGVVLRKMNRHEESLAACNLALKHNSDYPEALLNKAVTLQQLARREQEQGAREQYLEHNMAALAAYNQALSLRPNYTEALLRARRARTAGRGSEMLRPCSRTQPRHGRSTVQQGRHTALDGTTFGSHSSYRRRACPRP